MKNVFIDFLQNKPIYEKIEVTQENIADLANLFNGQAKIDCYCKQCKEKRVFQAPPFVAFHNPQTSAPVLLSDIILNEQNNWQLNSFLPQQESENRPQWYWCNAIIENCLNCMVLRFDCAMDHAHSIFYILKIEGNFIRKVGQYPSIASLLFPEIDRYRKILSEDDMKLLKRSIGLYSDGVGIGSFVYLRRIFENVIIQARDYAEKDNKIDLSNFQAVKMAEKIKILKAYLPEFVVENAQIYGIVSKGVHELSEEECLEYFPILRDSILIILRHWDQERQDRDAEKNIKKAISRIASNI